MNQSNAYTNQILVRPSELLPEEQGGGAGVLFEILIEMGGIFKTQRVSDLGCVPVRV